MSKPPKFSRRTGTVSKAKRMQGLDKYFRNAKVISNQAKVAANKLEQKIDKEELDLYYQARKKLSEMYNSDKYRIEFKLNRGDLLMMDNYRLLHGRTSFDSNEGNRFLQGCYIDYDSTEGKIRHLKRKFNI